MTKKHFEAVAQAIKDERNKTTQPEKMKIDRLACILANVFGDLNPRFDRGRFLIACGAAD